MQALLLQPCTCIRRYTIYDTPNRRIKTTKRRRKLNSIPVRVMYEKVKTLLVANNIGVEKATPIQ